MRLFKINRRRGHGINTIKALANAALVYQQARDRNIREQQHIQLNNQHMAHNTIMLKERKARIAEAHQRMRLRQLRIESLKSRAVPTTRAETIPACPNCEAMFSPELGLTSCDECNIDLVHIPRPY